jgi:FAD/FMN-containing dehydrogenase
VPPGREADVLASAFLAYPGTGIAYVAADVDALRGLRARCEAMGGALILERASVADKRALGVWGARRNVPRIARELKARFDPHGILAPGRFPA